MRSREPWKVEMGSMGRNICFDAKGGALYIANTITLALLFISTSILTSRDEKIKEEEKKKEMELKMELHV